MSDSLRAKIRFSTHNLLMDDAFGRMNVVVCHNVLIYFDRDVRSRALRSVRDSLVRRGFLCLGDKETINTSLLRDDFEAIAQNKKIYRKVI